MSVKNIKRIFTEDTKKTYEFPDKDNPPIWAVKITIGRIANDGSYYEHASSNSVVIHVEEKTLQDAGLVLRPRGEEPKPLVETPEELIIRLLEHVGVYPED